MIYIKNAHVVLENGILWDGVISVKDDKIVEFGTDIEIPESGKVIDANGAYVGPGFVDIHVHGAKSKLFVEAPEEVTTYFLEHGTTTILPTLFYSMTKDELLEAIDTIRCAKQSKKVGATIGGIYMEGPYMNPKYGAMPEKNQWRGDIRREDYREVLEAAKDIAKVWSIAPEREGIEEFLKDLKRISPSAVVSVGHSEATPSEVRKLRHYGIRLQTHSTNATGMPQSRRGTRSCGPDEASLLDLDMYAELISDSMAIHVIPDMQRLLIHVKGVDKVILITDCNAGESCPPENLAHVKDLMFDLNGRLNGSLLTMDMACRNVMTHTECGIVQAFLMASRNPARLLGIEDSIGSIAVGKKANLVFVDHMFHVQNVMMEGKLISELL